jgi:pRiA4b ORF-3-like protein
MQKTYVFKAELVGFQAVRRTITVRDDLTLVDLHYALQSAFDWDDDHLYSFWLDGGFWDAEEARYMHPYHASSVDPPGKSACARLAELDMFEGQRIAYEFDFERGWRVQLELREIRAEPGPAVARCVEREGAAPPQYDRGVFEEEADAPGTPAADRPALRYDEVDAA